MTEMQPEKAVGLIPLSFEAELDGVLDSDNLLRFLFAPPPSWQQRLAWAVDDRRIRNRVRRGATELRRRLMNVRLALAGAWEAEPDD